MKLKLKPKHFWTANYTDGSTCGVSNAAKDHFKTTGVLECITVLSVTKNNQTIFYEHKEYNWNMFSRDKILSYVFFMFPNMTINTITLIEPKKKEVAPFELSTMTSDDLINSTTEILETV